MSTKIDKSLILNKIKSHYKIKSDADFARFLEIKPQTLASWHTRNTYDVDLLYSKCVDIDGNFLISGEGEMLKAQQPEISIRSLKTDRAVDKQSIPLYDLVASAGVNEIFGESNLSVPLDYIRVPNLPKSDGALYVRGDSMYPLLKAGDIVIYKIVHDKSQIIWGEMYLCHLICNGDEYFFTKFIKKGEKDGHALFVSQNQHHQPVEFPIDSIQSLALIKASIRINSQI